MRRQPDASVITWCDAATAGRIRDNLMRCGDSRTSKLVSSYRRKAVNRWNQIPKNTARKADFLPVWLARISLYDVTRKSSAWSLDKIPPKSPIATIASHYLPPTLASDDIGWKQALCNPQPNARHPILALPNTCLYCLTIVRYRLSPDGS